MVDEKQPKAKDRKKNDRVTCTKDQKYLKLFFYCLFLIIWTGAAVIVSQLIVGYLMVWIVGKESFSQPLMTTVFMALSYILALVLVIFVPPRLKNRLGVNQKQFKN